jgi:hypothetical protein
MPRTTRTTSSAPPHRELPVIAEHRKVATGDLRTALMRVEARWAVHGAWLCEDTGDRRERAARLEHALCLGHEADHPDLIASVAARELKRSPPHSALDRDDKRAPSRPSRVIGQECHIDAQSDDGPRGPSSLTPDEQLRWGSDR